MRSAVIDPWNAPSPWARKRFKYLGSFVGGGTPSKDRPDFWVGNIPWVSPKDMKAGTVRDTEDHISPAAVLNSATRLIPPGAVLIVVRSGILQHSIPSAVNAVEVALNQDMKAFLPGRTCSSRFVRYIIEGHQDRLLTMWRKEGATVESLDVELMSNTILAFPDRATQDRTAAFLDHKTAAIDELIKKKERLIELLQEKRQALITHAVTKGLDPKVSMKDSGYEWIGSIPSHWHVAPTHLVSRLESGHTPSRQHPEYWVPEECVIPWFSLADVWQLRDGKSELVTVTEEKISHLGIANSAARLLPAGTVIVSRTASVGFSGILGCPMATTQDFVNWICGPKLRPAYLLYVFRTMRDEFRRMVMGSTHQTIYMPDVARFVTPVPPIVEQDAIVDFIRGEVRRIDLADSSTRKQIDHLREYRQALISAAVTGRLDVSKEAA